MKITRLSTDYLIKDKRLEITATVDENGITLYNQKDELAFYFMDSQPEMLVRIGAMIRKVGLKAMKGKL